jgi:hypothetical protein
MPFQTAIYSDPAPAIAGDFASANPWSSLLAGPGQIVSGASGVTPGRFVWLDSTRTLASNTGTGVPDGLVKRSPGQALITTYLAEAGNLIQPGQPLTVYDEIDMWVATTTTATVKQKVFAVLATGAIATGAAGATISGAVETRFYVHSAGAVGELIKISHRAIG